MRRQVSVLVALISTAIVASFVIPLLLLVSTLAADRGMEMCIRDRCWLHPSRRQR